MATPDDELDYLSPSFDPASLTMPRLRNILMSHDVAYPASAKKPQLIDIFTQELKPRARKILAARDRVRRTSRGITDMPSSQEGTVNGDLDEAGSMPPPPIPDTPRQRRSRKPERLSVEPIQESPVATKSSGGRRASSKHARQSDTDTDRDAEYKRPSVRKNRKNEATPQIKLEESEERPIRPPMRGGVFSDENPFQSGSSPPAPSEHRRRSAGTSSEKRKSSSNRRKTEDIAITAIKQEDGFVVPTSKTFDIPLSRLNQAAIKHQPEHEMEVGEDFTPEEQLELIRERAANGERDIFPPQRKKRSKKSAVPKSAPWVVFMALIGGYGTWWRQEKIAVGYCGIGRPSTAISNVQIPEWARALQPVCEPCPQHAICYQNMETRCEHDFVLQPHPLSLRGLLPLPPTCEPDGEKVRRVKTVADRAVEELRERKAQAECGTLKDDRGKGIPAEIDEEDLKRVVAKKRRRGMSEAEFEELWKGAIGEIMGREEVVSSSDGTHLHLSSTSLARLPLACTIRRSARLTLAKHRLSFSVIALFTATLLYVRSTIITVRTDTARVPTLVATTLDRLATQAALHSRGDAAESWISVGQLRDDVLRDEFSDKRRESMWKRVRTVVEKNANVRASVREGRGGDVSRVWEWIGSVGLLDELWSSGRDSGAGKRASFGGFIDKGTLDPRASSTVAGAGAGREMVEQRKWDEGRPIY